MAGLRQALVVIGLAAGARVARWTEALEGAGCVEAGAAMFTETGALLSHLTLVQVLVAGGPCVARLTHAECGAAQGVGAALGFLVAWLTQTHVLHVAQEACAPRWAEAGEGAHAVKAGGPGGAGGGHTVVQVLLAASASPATHAHTVEVAS